MFLTDEIIFDFKFTHINAHFFNPVSLLLVFLRKEKKKGDKPEKEKKRKIKLEEKE